MAQVENSAFTTPMGPVPEFEYTDASFCTFVGGVPSPWSPVTVRGFRLGSLDDYSDALGAIMITSQGEGNHHQLIGLNEASLTVSADERNKTVTFKSSTSASLRVIALKSDDALIGVVGLCAMMRIVPQATAFV